MYSNMKKLLTIKVTSKLLAKSEAGGWANHVVSLVDPGTELPDFGFGCRHHVGFFEDHENPVDPNGPKLMHISDALAFGSKFEDGDNVLVHCHGGICRSTAMAMMFHIQAGFIPEEALKRVERNRPQMWPNSLVVALGDNVLGLEGAAIRALDAFIEENNGKIVW